MITFKVEAAIDLDENRKVWITGKLECDPSEVNAVELIDGATKSVTQQALHGYHDVAPEYRVGKPRIPGGVSDEEKDRAALAGEGKEVDPTRTFGDPD